MRDDYADPFMKHQVVETEWVLTLRFMFNHFNGNKRAGLKVWNEMVCWAHLISFH